MFLVKLNLSSANASNLDINKATDLLYGVELTLLLKDKILGWSKFRAFADDKINVTEKLKFVLEMVENTVGKGENAGYQRFLLFTQYFQKLSFTGLFEVEIVW